MSTDSLQMKRCRKALFKLGWLHPFFAIPIGRCRLVEDDSQQCPTAFVTLRGKIHFNPTFFATLSDAEVMGVLAHEICHPLFGHHGRRAGRDGTLWNVVTDMAINQGLKDSGITLPDCALYPADAWTSWNAERIYDELTQNPDQQPQPQPGQGEDGDGQPQPTAGCGIEPDPDGDDDDGDDQGEGAGAGDDSDDSSAPGAGKSDSELEREWREVAIQAATMDAQASRGSGKGSALARITEIPAPKVRWGSIVRKGAAEAITAAGRDQQSWTRRGRRSAVRGPQFPGWIKNAPKLAIVIDTSGSMSDEILAQAVAEVLGALKASEIPAYLVTHDHGVQWEGWVSPRTRPADVTATFKGRGGTCAREAYRCVGQQRDRFDVFIHLTDCYLTWPEFPANARQRIIARMGRGGSLREGPEGQRHRLVDVQI